MLIYNVSTSDSMKRIFLLMTIATVAWAIVSCRSNQDLTPSIEFAPYISAYTGGVIGSDGTIRIELTEEQQIVQMGEEVKDDLFDFSPGLKGKTYWVNSRTIEFVPDSGQLRPGTLYNATFRLGRVMKVEKKLDAFRFSYRVQARDFTARITSTDITASAPDRVTVCGELRLSEAPKADEVAKMVTAKHDGDKPKVTVTRTEDARVYRFTVSEVAKKEADTELSVTIDGGPFGADYKETLRATIPGTKPPFKLMQAEMIDEPESGACLTFSAPVSTTQDVNGLVTLRAGEGGSDGAVSYTCQVQDNKVRLFFERRSDLKAVAIEVDGALRSVAGDALTASSSVRLEVKSLNPQVEFLSEGTIMPNAEQLILPFRAVNLYAVDLKIIRIFERNVLTFLQDNSLEASSSSELRRTGRLVYRKMLRLDSDATKDIHNWDNYFIDLSKLIRQEPGAIYRVVLSFKREYSAYPCDSVEGGARNLGPAGMTRLDENELGEADEATWDKPQTYYYDGADMDWDTYQWEERDNPCSASYYMSSDRMAATNVLASNLGLIVKANANNTLWVAVSNLIDTKPLSGVEVTAYNFQLQPIGSAKTDDNGFAEIKTKNKPFALVATASDKQKGYLRLVDGEENMLSRFDIGGKETERGLKGFIYGERGVWRPGDTLHVTFMMEDREKRIPQNHPVSIEIFNPRGQFYTKQISVSGVNGMYVFHIPTRPDDPTGLWNAYVKVGGASFHKALRIETVKPNRLKINLTLPGQILQVSPLPVPMNLESAWLTGAVARGLKAKVEMSLTKVPTQFKGYEKYTFDNPAAAFTSGTTDLFDGALSDLGKASFLANLPTASDAPGMLQANLTCRVFEPGGDASLFTQSIPFSPFPVYVGVKLGNFDQGQTLETDRDHHFEVVTLSPDGKPLNRQGLEYKIYKVNWSWWWEHDDETFASYLNNASIVPVAAGTINTVGSGKAVIPFRVNYPEWGRYLVYIKDREGGHATGGTIYVDWPEWRGRSNKSDPNGIKMLAFALDKSSYEVGETATAIIPASTGGRALVAIENGTEVLHREWVNMAASGDTKYSFKVTEGMAPNVYLHITLIQPYAQTANDLPIRMYGVMPVFVTHKNSILKPLIVMQDVLRPEADFTVQVKEQSGRPMTYTLAIVDDGLLDLTNFQTPDPWNTFYAREALGIRTWDMYDFVMGAYAGRLGSLFSVGGDESLRPVESKANRFKPVVKFLGPFALKKGETQTHKLKLPPYIGSVRVMVVAGQEGAYGRAEKRVAVRAPLMVLSSLPRVVSTDEEILFPVNVFAMESGVKNVTVKVETTGKLRLTEGSSQSITFAAPGDKPVFFKLRSGLTTGIERIVVTATGGGHSSKETIEIGVRNPNPPIVRIDSRLIAAGSTGLLTYQTGFGGSSEGWASLEVARIPSPNLSRCLDFLSDYPHYCTEQVTSAALPLLYVGAFRELDKRETDAIRENVRRAVQDLYSRQLPGGAFTYWPGGLQEDEWATSYVGTFLVLAREKGYEVNAGALNRWKSYQRRAAQGWRPAAKAPSRFAIDQGDLVQAYRLYALALAGAPELGAMNRLRESRTLSMQARWRLAAAYALAGKPNIANELIFRLPLAVATYDWSNPTYGSPERDQAMILEALVLMGRDREAFEQARRVSQSLTTSQEFATQSTAYALLALGRLAERTSGSLQFDWSLNGGKQPTVNSQRTLFRSQLPTFPPVGLVSVKNNGKGQLYVSLTTKMIPLRDSLPAVSEGLRMEVTYTDRSGRALSVDRLPQGTDLVAVVKVSNPSAVSDYTNLALTQIIPSGWEIYNERLITPEDVESGASATSYTYRDIRDDRVLTYFDLKRGETKTFRVRLQASYAGSFILPAIRCAAMYAPGVQARTRASRVVVER